MKVVHIVDTRIATLSGVVLNLKANVPHEIPESLLPLAIAHGARQCDENAPAVEPMKIEIGKEPDMVPEQPPAESNHEKLVRIMKDIVDRGQTDEFRSDGQPKASLLNRMFGRVVTEEERTAAWEAVMKKNP